MYIRSVLTLTSLTSLLSALSLFVAPAVQAQVVCGDTITTNTTLTADLGPCGTKPALFVKGPASLDMGGHTVSCTGAFDGIALTGQAAKLRNGVVTGCVDGIDFGGTGRHRVERVLATNNGIGFAVNIGSDKNRLNHNWATDNTIGFQVKGTQCTLIKNTSTTNVTGFRVESIQTMLRKNTAARNTDVGFFLDGSKHLVLQNVAQQNGDNGFFTVGNSRELTLKQNQALDNAIDGIHHNGTDSKLQQNTALGNAGFDLVDSQADCDNNTWKKNIFGSALPAVCIE